MTPLLEIDDVEDLLDVGDAHLSFPCSDGDAAARNGGKPSDSCVEKKSVRRRRPGLAVFFLVIMTLMSTTALELLSTSSISASPEDHTHHPTCINQEKVSAKHDSSHRIAVYMPGCSPPTHCCTISQTNPREVRDTLIRGWGFTMERPQLVELLSYKIPVVTSSSLCLGGKVYESCAPTCSNLKPDCPKARSPGCVCGSGTVDNGLGECVNIEKCDFCSGNTTYISCGRPCSPHQICAAVCVEKCVCKSGYVSLPNSNRCVLRRDLP
ncbi:uncharacterized protein LOC122926322 [Bufo gargarizans]|uniref:uncharacterized protein LOC122926322 n=1 Tax=Bufo gargarizans TaxID=30331 RepID=UPI001CF45DF8|nr:uncharacterized protein LOC122926322 [Bufo gargarizans]